MTDTVTKLKLKYGEIELEIEGDSETVARERSEFQKTLVSAIEVLSRKMVFQQSIPQNIGIIEQKIPEQQPQLISCDNKLEFKKYSRFNQLVKEKKFDTDVDRVLGAAYFLSISMDQQEFTKNDILEQFKNAKLKTPSNTATCLANNVEKDFIQPVGTGEKNMQIYSILDEGIEYCETYEPKEETTKAKKTNKTSKPKSTKDYPSLDITVDELHLEKYCNLSKLSSYIEQIWVLMFIYYSEKGQKTFTRDEVTQMLRKRFGINPTDRQIKRFFEKAGTNLHKEGSRKDMTYTLMQGGIDEAQRIIAENTNTK